MSVLKYLLFLILLTATGAGFGQPRSDSARLADSLVRDSLRRVAVTDSLRRDSLRLDSLRLDSLRRDSLIRSTFRIDTLVLGKNRFFRFEHPIRYGVTPRQWEGKEEVFYTLIALLLLFALIRNGFHRYLQDLSGIFFRTSPRQRQLKEQMMQSPLPSLLLNIFFVLSAGLFITLICSYFGLGQRYGFWLLFLYAVVGVGFIYLVKFIGLKVLGWIFGLREAIDSYIFVVFTTNKVIGIVLLPFAIVLAFATGRTLQAAVALSGLVVGLLFLYRYYLSYLAIHRQVKLNVFHFFLYLCAFEIAPLLLINKLLFRFLA